MSSVTRKTLAIWIILLVKNMCSNAEYAYFLSSNTATWEEANKACALATPLITYTPTGVSVNMPNINVRDGEKVWLGYYKATTVFQYMGCVKKEEISYLSRHSTGKKPAECFSACHNSGLFGMSSNSQYQCYCLGSTLSNAKDTQPRCNQPCDDPRHTACGSDTYLSVYKEESRLSVTANVSTSSGGFPVGNCLLYNYNPPRSTLFKVICTHSQYVMCHRSNNELPALIMTFSHTKQRQQWLGASSLCLQYNFYPLRIESMLKISSRSLTRGESAWSGMFYGSPIRKANVTPQTYGYALKTSTQHRHTVQFGSNQKLRYVCQKEITTTQASTTTTPTSLSTTPVTAIGTTTQDTSTDPQSEPEPEDEINAAKLALYVGIPVAALLLVAIVAVFVVICMKKRRRGSSHWQHELSTEVNTTHDGSKGYSENESNLKNKEYINGTTYNDMIIPKDKKEPTQPECDQNNRNNKQLGGMDNGGYNGGTHLALAAELPDEGDTYDVASAGEGIKTPAVVNDGMNVYNKLHAQEPEDEYNIAQTGDRDVKIGDPRDSTYDSTTTPTVRLPTDNIYDKTANDIVIDKADEDQSDITYAQPQKFKRAKARQVGDDVYDVANLKDGFDVLKKGYDGHRADTYSNANFLRCDYEDGERKHNLYDNC